MALPQGFEPRFLPPEGSVLSITLWEHSNSGSEEEKGGTRNSAGQCFFTGTQSNPGKLANPSSKEASGRPACKAMAAR
jgi:hypothetical protein